ncbi:replication factor C subunit 3 [Rhyzopertha dominica]|nr:replication factor C subunit 3 [Rhyzopertha dominica]
MTLLWLDKHRPHDLKKLDFHKEQAQHLLHLAQQSDLPHLLVYGPAGAGKKTRIMCLLKEIYGSGVERLRMENMVFTTPSNKKLEIMTISSNYHIEVNPSEAGIYDRIVVMQLIKKIAQAQQLDSQGQRDFKVILITEADTLTKDAQHALRRTMEKYVSNCRLILCANSISRVIPAVRSRCLSIRVPAPSIDDICSVLHMVCKKEGLSLPSDLAKRIAEKSDRNLRRALLMCEACKVEKYPFTEDANVAEPDWLVFIKDTARKILQEQSIAQLGRVRENFYELIGHGIPPDVVFVNLLKELFKKCNVHLKAKVVDLAAHYEHRMQYGNKEIFHFEAFVAKFMQLYQEDLRASLEM